MLRWLLRKFHICPNAYYNYLKNRKADYLRKKKAIKASIQEIYHSHDRVDGYRTIHSYLLRRGISVSCLTVHKSMNTEMQLFSISRRKKTDYKHGTAHKVYENKLQQDFYAPEINQKWCTDFTYLFLHFSTKRMWSAFSFIKRLRTTSAGLSSPAMRSVLRLVAQVSTSKSMI